MGNVNQFEADCLAFKIIEGDDKFTKIIQDKMVVSKFRGVCSMCKQTIQIGELVRTSMYDFEGNTYYYRYCHECCKAMVAFWWDDGLLLEERYELANKD